MAEASFQAYILVAFAMVLLVILLFWIRFRHNPPPYRIASSNWFSVGFFAIIVGVMFIYIGITLSEFSILFAKYHDDETYKFKEPSQIKLEDYEPMRDWITHAEIIDTDDRPLKIGVEKRLHGIVESQRFPQELIMYVFHEDWKDFFTNESDPSAFRQITKDIGRIPMLKYGSLFYVKFNMTNCYQGNQSDNRIPEGCTPLNAFNVGQFNYPGKYFVQFSAKLSDDNFDHRFVPMHLTIIPTDREIFDTVKIGEIRSKVDFQKFETQNALGVAYIGIGVGMFFSGLSLIQPVIIRRNGNEER